MTARPDTTQTIQREDPREAGSKPPFPEQQQELPGSDTELRPAADHGEETYVGGTGRLAGLVALVTGGDSGIGRAVAIAFAREGADVVVSYLNEEQDARETTRLVEESGRRTLAIPGDISDETHCRKIIDDAVREFGQIDILVNNAAHQRMFDSIESIPSEEWRRTFATNIDSMFFLCKAALPHMQPGSSIINVASVEAYKPEPQLLAYATTKGAIVTFSKALAQELAPRGIRVNVVAPGPVWTPLIPASSPPEQVAEFGKSTPIGRAAQPVEVAPAFVFLASPDATYVTGTVVGVHGGMPMP